ncbi:MAG: protein-(glutamine-N5) methyltransferase, release factor-specific, partial [Chloroflexi bacterium]
IVSNPPYVARPTLRSRQTMPEVRQFEPHTALDGGESGLESIEPLLAQAAKKLRPGGSLLVEIGFDQGRPVLQLARRYFPQAKIAVKKDLAGLDRLLVVKN